MCIVKSDNLIIIKIKLNFYEYYNNLINYVIDRYFNYNNNHNL